MLLSVGDEYEKQIAANREADAPYRWLIYDPRP
jgi:hypothetical protein